MGAPSNYLAVCNSTEPTKAKASLGDFTLVQTEAAANSGLSSGRIFWKTVGFTSTRMNLLDLRPDFIKVDPDTICTEPYYFGDDYAAFVAVSAPAQKKMVVFKKSLSADGHESVSEKRLI